MTRYSGQPEIIAPEYRYLWRENPHGLAHGWDFYRNQVPDLSVLDELYTESLRARSRALNSMVPRSSGDFSNSLVEPGQLHDYPATQQFANEAAQKIGGRVLSAQFNFYGPDGRLLPHNDGPNPDSETIVTLSLSGEADYEILPDLIC